ncbi:MAG: putative TPR repeat methyltransferase [Sneathiella sp.]
MGGLTVTIYETGAYLETNSDWHEEDGAWKAGQILKMLAKQSLKPSTIVDVGCGAGEVLSTLAHSLDADVKCQGFDIAEVAINIAKRKETSSLQFKVSDFLVENREIYDLVLLMDVFEHVPDYLGFLSQLRKSGHHFLFHIPLDMNVLHVLLDHQTRSRAEAGHLHYFSKSSALLTLEDAGFDVIDWFYTPVFQTAKAKRSLSKRLIELPRAAGLAFCPDFSVRLLGGCSLLVLAKPALKKDI